MLIAKRVITIAIGIVIVNWLSGCSSKQNINHDNISIVIKQAYQNTEIFPYMVAAENILSPPLHHDKLIDSAKTIGDTAHPKLDDYSNTNDKEDSKPKYVLWKYMQPQVYIDENKQLQLTHTVFLGASANSDTSKINYYLSLQNIHILFPAGINFKWVSGINVFYLIGYPHNIDSLFLDSIDINDAIVTSDISSTDESWLARTIKNVLGVSKHDTIISLNSHGTYKLKRLNNTGAHFLIAAKISGKVYYTSLTLDELSTYGIVFPYGTPAVTQ